MPIKIISPEENPEEYARMKEWFKKCKECEMRGHGQLLVSSDGFAFCQDCEQPVLDCLDDDEDDDQDD